MNSRLLPALLASSILGAAAVAPAQAADTTLTPAPDGVNIAAGGGYVVWSKPEEDTGWKLVVRAPDGVVSTPDVRGMPGPADVAIGSTGGSKDRLTAVYARPRGASTDLYALDLATGKEHRVAVSSRSYDELAPSLYNGRLAFVRRGGKRDGVYLWSGSGASQRISSASAIETALSRRQVAYATSRRVVLRRVAGSHKTDAIFAPTNRPRSLQLDDSRVGWLGSDGQIFGSARLKTTRSSKSLPVRKATPRPAPQTQSFAFGSGTLGDLVLDRFKITSLGSDLTFGG